MAGFFPAHLANRQPLFEVLDESLRYYRGKLCDRFNICPRWSINLRPDNFGGLDGHCIAWTAKGSAVESHAMHEDAIRHYKNPIEAIEQLSQTCSAAFTRLDYQLAAYRHSNLWC